MSRRPNVTHSPYGDGLTTLCARFIAGSLELDALAPTCVLCRANLWQREEAKRAHERAMSVTVTLDDDGEMSIEDGCRCGDEPTVDRETGYGESCPIHTPEPGPTDIVETLRMAVSR